MARGHLYRDYRYSSVLGRGVHTDSHHYYPSWGVSAYLSHRHYRPYSTVCLPGPTVYVERIYEQPAEQIIQYVPIEDAPAPPPPGPTVDVPDAGPFLQQGDVVFRQGRYDEARRLYVRALLADGGAGIANYPYSLCHFALGEYGVGASAMRRALTAVPELMDAPPDPRALYDRAEDFDRQLAALQEHVARSPRDADARFLLAYLDHAIGRGAAALEQLDRVLGMDDTDTLAYVLRDVVARAQTASGPGVAP